MKPDAAASIRLVLIATEAAVHHLDRIRRSVPKWNTKATLGFKKLCAGLVEKLLLLAEKLAELESGELQQPKPTPPPDRSACPKLPALNSRSHPPARRVDRPPS